MKHDLLEGPESSPLWKTDMTWYGSYGFGLAENSDEYSKFFTGALNSAFSDRELELDLLVCEGSFCGATGYLIGNFTGPFLGEQPSLTTTRLRFGLHWHVDVENSQIIEGYGMFDLQHFFAQVGIDLYARARDQIKA